MATTRQTEKTVAVTRRSALNLLGILADLAEFERDADYCQALASLGRAAHAAVEEGSCVGAFGLRERLARFEKYEDLAVPLRDAVVAARAAIAIWFDAVAHHQVDLGAEELQRAGREAKR